MSLGQGLGFVYYLHLLKVALQIFYFYRKISSVAPLMEDIEDAPLIVQRREKTTTSGIWSHDISVMSMRSIAVLQQLAKVRLSNLSKISEDFHF